jgi:hypothetical protein
MSNEIYTIRNRALEYAYTDDLASLQETEAIRKRNYLEFWKLYKGLHWEVAELEDDKPTAVQNKCFLIINKLITFLVGKPPTINYFNDEVEQLLAPYINLVLKNSGELQALAFEVAQMGGVTGDCFLKPVHDPVLGGVRIQVCDSMDVDVRYPFYDYSNIIPSRAVIRWNYLEEQPFDQPPEIVREDGLPQVMVREYKEVWTPGEKIVYIDDVLQRDKSGANILGVVPIVHIRNLVCGKEVYGMSDIEQIEPLNKLLNHQLKRFSNDIDYCGDPITLLFGARVSTMEKGENHLWGNLPIKGRVENLTLDTDFPAQQKFIDYMEEAIHEIGNVPKESVTGDPNISNTSGVALHMNNLPILEAVDRKKIFYGKGLESALMMALDLMVLVEKRQEIVSTMSEEAQIKLTGNIVNYSPTGILDAIGKVQNIYASSKDPYVQLKKWNEVDVVFSDYLPKDRLVEMQLLKEEMGVGLESRRGALKRLGRDNIDQKLEEIESEFKQTLENELQDMYGSGGSKNITQGMRLGEDMPEGASKEIVNKT